MTWVGAVVSGATVGASVIGEAVVFTGVVTVSAGEVWGQPVRVSSRTAARSSVMPFRTLVVSTERSERRNPYSRMEGYGSLHALRLVGMTFSYLNDIGLMLAAILLPRRRYYAIIYYIDVRLWVPNGSIGMKGVMIWMTGTF